MNKFVFPTTLIAVMAIAMVFAFTPVQDAQTLHLPTIGSSQITDGSITSADITDGTIANVDLAAQAIPISTDIVADVATTTAGAIVDLGDILLTYTGTHTIVITVSTEVALNSATVSYGYSIPALGVGTDCGSGDNAIHTQPVWTGTAGTESTSSFTAVFVCTGVPSATAIQVGHTSTTNVGIVGELALVGIAYPTQ